MSENSRKDPMIISQTGLPPTSTVPAIVECVPVFVDARGVVHYHERTKPVQSAQIVMHATHYRHWLPLSDSQVWEVIDPAEFTDEEAAIVRQHGKAALKRFLVSALVIFVLLCIATTDNAVRSSAIQFAHAIDTALTPVLVTCLATPLAFAADAVFQAVLPIYHLLTAVISFSAYACSELWQLSKPIRSIIGTFIRTYSTEFLKEWGNHIVTAWESPIRSARRYPKEVFLYTLPNKVYCFGKYSWIALIIDTIFTISFAWVLPYHLARYTVVFAKILFFALPVLYISPYDRLVFWPALLLTVALEICIAAVLIWAHGYGHFWGARARFTIYRTWEKHFRYTRQTFDSLDRMRGSYSVFYPAWKLWIFMDQWCYDNFMYEQRLKYPNVGTNAFADKTFPVGYKTPKQLAVEAAIEAIDQAARDKKALFWANYKKKHDFYVQVARDHFARAEKMWDAREGEAHKALDNIRNHRWVDIHTIVKARQSLRPKPVLQNYLDYYISRNNAVHKPAMDYYNYVWQLPSQIKTQPQVRPATRSKASLLPDYDYFTTIIEQDTAVNLKYGLLFILALSSLTVYSIILAGWSSNSKYAFIGALRSAAQMISYEVAISLILLPVVLLAGSLNITMVVYMQSITVWFLFPLLPAAILFIIAMLAETNRTPFDLPEAEAELVAGYNVDYSALPFAMFFLGEYCNMILISVLFCLLFLGGWSLFGYYGVIILVIKAIAVWFYFIHVRATLPRYRYDQLMDNGWKIFLPIAGGFFIFIVGVLVGLDALPVTTELPLQEISRFTAAACIAMSPAIQSSVKSSREHLYPNMMKPNLLKRDRLSCSLYIVPTSCLYLGSHQTLATICRAVQPSVTVLLGHPCSVVHTSLTPARLLSTQRKTVSPRPETITTQPQSGVVPISNPPVRNSRAWIADRQGKIIIFWVVGAILISVWCCVPAPFRRDVYGRLAMLLTTADGALEMASRPENITIFDAFAHSASKIWQLLVRFLVLKVSDAPSPENRVGEPQTLDDLAFEIVCVLGPYIWTWYAFRGIWLHVYVWFQTDDWDHPGDWRPPERYVVALLLIPPLLVGVLIVILRSVSAETLVVVCVLWVTPGVLCTIWWIWSSTSARIWCSFLVFIFMLLVLAIFGPLANTSLAHLLLPLLTFLVTLTSIWYLVKGAWYTIRWSWRKVRGKHTEQQVCVNTLGKDSTV